jgi:tripeptide aminopeptidase
MAVASGEERARLADRFVRLCEIESPSGREREMARAVREELEAIGLEVTEDETAAATGADCGNLITRIHGREGAATEREPGAEAGRRGARAVMLCAHLDTVPLTDGVEVERFEGFFRNRREAILGADNKAAVAVLVEVARRYAVAGSPVPCELVFTTSEEIGLRGAAALDRSLLSSEFGYVFDHASPIGELILAAPTYYRVSAEFRGIAAHSGIRPELGRSAISAAAKAIEAMRLGRLDDETTANVGRIEGGIATNVVPARCRVEAEVRSLDDAKATTRVQEMLDALTWAASSTDTDVDSEVEEQFRAYRIPRSDPCVEVAAAALADCGIEPVYTSTGGGSDANAFEAKGLRCLNVANGTEANHTADERVSEHALETMLDVTIRLLERAAEA